MRRFLLVGGILLILVASVVGVAMASESYVISDVSGGAQHGKITTVNPNYGWKSAPENPNVVYIAVWAPKPYEEYIQSALVNVVRKHGLKPVIAQNITAYDLKGRVVLFYAPVIGRANYLLTEERSISGILYYSYAGDAKSAVEVINSGLTISATEISKSADKLCGTSMGRLTKLRIANQTCDVAYWWNLKAKVGKLKSGNPYEMIANEIASQLDNFIKSDESNEP
ncbi:hypothetical protein [Thermococcus sp.]|uniref:hypothetical protein n=1 Tax=Thermococcus sp. TaxID=35749 RepID=UPI0026272D44|nr:hypothetical protein [Thermococcus sp.]